MANKNNMTAGVLAQADKDLYDVIIKMGITPDSKQLITWFINTKNSVSAKALTDLLNKIFPGVKYFTKYSIETIKQSDGGCTIIINTNDFLFNIQNVINFSRSLLEIASKNGGEYDFWEIEIDKSKL